MKYVILEHVDIADVSCDSTLDFVGFAESVEAATQLIKEEARVSFNPESLTADFSDYCSQFYICEIVKGIHPRPSVKIKLVEIAKEIQCKQ